MLFAENRAHRVSGTSTHPNLPVQNVCPRSGDRWRRLGTRVRLYEGGCPSDPELVAFANVQSEVRAAVVSFLRNYLHFTPAVGSTWLSRLRIRPALLTRTGMDPQPFSSMICNGSEPRMLARRLRGTTSMTHRGPAAYLAYGGGTAV